MYNFDGVDLFDEYFTEFFGRLNDLDIPWGFVPGYHDYELEQSN